MKNFLCSFCVVCFYLVGIQIPLAQCNTNDATDCECLDNSENDCDLLPDIQASWYGLLNVSGGPTEYPQEGAGSNNGRLRISVSTPNTGVGPLTVRGVDENGYRWFICDEDTIPIYDPNSNENYYCDDRFSGKKTLEKCKKCRNLINCNH